MQEVQVTFGHIVQIWWALFWRTCFFLVLIVLILGFISGFVIRIADIQITPDHTTVWGVCIAVIFLATCRAISGVLGKKFSSFRITLTKI